MGVVDTPISTAGAVTQPTSTFRLLLPSAEAERFHGGAPLNTCRLPFNAGIAAADGISALRSIYEDNIDGISLLAPSTACTATPTGANATATLDLDADGAGGSAEYTIADGDCITLFDESQIIVFKTALTFPVADVSPAPNQNEVLIGANNSAALDNLRSFMDRSSGEGSTYHTHPLTDPIWDFISVTSKTASTVVLQVDEFGASGNAYEAYLGNQTTTGSGWSNASHKTQRTTVDTIGFFTGGSNGSGSAPAAGDFRYCYTYVRTVDGAESGRSPEVTASQGTAQNIDIDGLTASADASVDFLRIYRTEDMGQEFFRVAEVATGDVAGGYTDSTPDGEADDSLQGYGATAFDDLAHLKYRGGLAPRGKALAVWGGRGGSRLWQGGAWTFEDYSVAQAITTNGSATVTFESGAIITDDMRFNQFKVDGDSETYIIMAVDEATPGVTLDRNYQGSSAPGGADYVVKDVRDRNAVAASEELLYNQWPVVNRPGGVDPEDDDEGLTALFPRTGYMLMFSRTGRYAITGDGPDSWSIDRLGDEGCVSQQSVVRRGSTIYWIAPDGNVYAQVGNGVPSSISSPDFEPTNTLPFGIDRTMKRINYKHAHLISGTYVEDEEIILWSVPVDGYSYCNHTLVFDVASGRWLTDNIAYTSYVRVTDEDGNNTTLAGESQGNLWEIEHDDATNNDGAFGFEPVQTIGSSSTTSSLDLDSGTPYPTSGEGLDGVPVTVVYVNGSLASVLVESNTSGVLTLRTLLTTAPSSGDQSVAGCVQSIWKSGRFHAADKWDKATVKTMQIGHQKDADGEFHFAYMDDEDSALRTCDDDMDYQKGNFTDEDRASRFVFDEHTYGAQVQITVLEPGLTTAALTYITTDVDGRG